jgi:predicted nucleic acid-binding protein
MRYIVDSSVAAKWVIPEADSDKALRLLDEFQQGLHELLAPDWLLPEVANVLGKAAVVRKVLTPKEAADGFAAVQGLALKLFPSAPLTAQALDLAMTHQRAVYDCLYLALAINEGGQLVTADQPIVNQLAAVFPFVVSLSTLPS